ncbi:Peroxisomal (S)-2-hydroxy-acid oxidase GLO5 [Holothuria leucospilota]|uniref:Peroxisomal (S)-2-hydroxy-acid oxidase GLO5 n=1 Tax=Holothuria leucospilota TaxID=206669 RepID=A0A9Q1GY20_HOLLE|nr:Peroxisomal (S)-2-hydroxy-acid oxidase GLO5 [Holothuria leucospilota]
MEHGIIPTSVNEFEKLAEEKMAKDKKHRALWCYISLGTGDKQTLEDSKAAFRRFRFQPRILTAKMERSTQTTLLGNPVSLPIGISPVAGYSSLHPYGATLAGKAAARAGAVMILGSVGNISLEDFAERVPSDGLYWAQTYLFRDKRNTLRLVRNAERLGFKALVVTVDSPVEHKGAGSNKETMDEYTRTVVETPAANIRYVNGKEREISPASLSEVWTEAYKEVFCCANWEDLSWLQSETKLPIILKGVLSGEFHFKNSFSIVC